jgi:hypothetical protein
MPIDLLAGMKTLNRANSSGGQVDLLDGWNKDTGWKAPEASDFNFGKMVSNIPSSTGKVIKDTAEGLYNLVRHPQEMGESLGELARSTYNKAQQEYGFQKFGNEDITDTATAERVGAKLSEKYGTMGRTLNTVQNDPAGQLANLAGIMTGAGMATGIKGVANVGMAIDPINMMAKGIGGAVKMAAPKTGGVNLARELVKRDIAAAGLTIPQAQAKMDSMGTDISTLGDISPATRYRAETTGSSSATGVEKAEFYAKRGKESGTRIGKEIDNLFGDERVTLNQSVDDIAATTKEKSKPLYEAAYSKDIELTPELYKIMDTPDVQRAYKAAQRIAGNEGVKLPAELVESVPSMQTWDYIKRGLDQVIEKDGTGALGGKTSLGRNIGGLKSRLLSELDRLNPDYKKARGVYSDGASIREATLNGNDFWKKSVTDDSIKADLAKMGDGEKAGYRLGALQRIYNEALENPDSGSVYKRIFGNEMRRKKIEAVIQDDAAFKRLESSIGNESEFTKTLQDTLHNSKTFKKQQGQADTARGLAPDFVASGVMGAGRQKLVDAATALRSKSDKQNAELADILMTPNVNLEKALSNTPRKPSAAIGGQAVYQTGANRADLEELLKQRRDRLKRLAMEQ